MPGKWRSAWYSSRTNSNSLLGRDVHLILLFFSALQKRDSSIRMSSSVAWRRAGGKELIECQWPRSTQNQGDKCREIQKGRLVTRLSEVSARRGHRLKFDRAEPIRKVNGQDGDEKHNCHGN